MEYSHYSVNQTYAFSISSRKENARRDVTIFENGQKKEEFEYYDHFGKLVDLKNNILKYIKEKYIKEKYIKQKKQLEPEWER